MQGIIAAHVDAGLEIFQTRVIDRFCHVFAVKSEEVVEFHFIKKIVKILNLDRINM